MEVTRHFTATTFVVHQDKVLLHLHKKLGIWIPVGGHIDRDELPHDAAVREVKEETGLDVTLHPGPPPSFTDVQSLPRPQHILLEDINQFHQHIDLVFYAMAETAELSPEDGETTDLKWLSEEDLNSEEIRDHVRALSREALSLLKGKK